MPGVVRWRPRHKYNAVALTIDGHRFASLKEGRRYSELRLLEHAGQLWDLELQPVFPLHVPVPGGREQYIGVYRADFGYQTRDGRVVEDCKGFPTSLYKWKKKHVEAQYGIRIVEV